MMIWWWMAWRASMSVCMCVCVCLCLCLCVCVCVAKIFFSFSTTLAKPLSCVPFRFVDSGLVSQTKCSSFQPSNSIRLLKKIVIILYACKFDTDWCINTLIFHWWLFFYLQIKKGPQKGQIQEVIKRKNSLTDIMKISLRYIFLPFNSLLVFALILLKIVWNLFAWINTLPGTCFAALNRTTYSWYTLQTMTSVFSSRNSRRSFLPFLRSTTRLWRKESWSLTSEICMWLVFCSFLLQSFCYWFRVLTSFVRLVFRMYLL